MMLLYYKTWIYQALIKQVKSPSICSRTPNRVRSVTGLRILWLLSTLRVVWWFFCPKRIVWLYFEPREAATLR